MTNASTYPVREVYRRLRAEYLVADLGNQDDPLDELIYIVVSGKTSEQSYQRTYNQLKHKYSHWETVLQDEPSKLIDILQPSGLARKKAKWITSLLRAIQIRVGDTSLGSLGNMCTSQAETFLTSLPGVGIKTARCVLMYSLGRDVFPVDAHASRILKRLGWTQHHRLTDRVQDRIQDLIPPDLRYNLHILLIQHGRSVCTARNPRCDACILLSLCPTGQERAFPKQ